MWPLLVVLLLLVTRGAAARARRTVLLAGCAAGAAASTMTAVILSRHAAADRIYYGTDTRAAALLVGCALAVVLTGRVPQPGRGGCGAPLPHSAPSPPLCCGQP